MKKDLAQQWTFEETLLTFDPHRELFREASADLIRKIFQTHVSSEHKILEIGSGYGELVRLVPEYKNQIQQTDHDSSIVMKHKSANPDSNIVFSDAYDTGFVDSSFDLVVSHSVFDTLVDLETALNETKRVLVPGGKFIHFLDIGPSDNVFLRECDSNYVPFPLFEMNREIDAHVPVGLQLVRKSEIDKIKKISPPGSESFFDDYARDPEALYLEGIANEEYFPLFVHVSQFIKRSGVETLPVIFADEFKKKMENNLADLDYNIIKSDFEKGTAIVHRNGRHADRPEFNLFVNDLGIDTSRYDVNTAAELKPGEVKTISKVYVVVAEKL